MVKRRPNYELTYKCIAPLFLGLLQKLSPPLTVCCYNNQDNNYYESQNKKEMKINVCYILENCIQASARNN